MPELACREAVCSDCFAPRPPQEPLARRLRGTLRLGRRIACPTAILSNQSRVPAPLLGTLVFRLYAPPFPIRHAGTSRRRAGGRNRDRNRDRCLLALRGRGL